jgi:hypothetical protein
MLWLRVIGLLAVALSMSPAWAQSNYPDRTVRILVGFGPLATRR